MKTSEEGIAMIKKNEGIRKIAAIPKGDTKVTIGYGRNNVISVIPAKAGIQSFIFLDPSMSMDDINYITTNKWSHSCQFF